MRRLLCFVFILAFTHISYSQTGLNARSMGMAGAYNSMALGSEVTRWNPANLGFPLIAEYNKMPEPHPYWPRSPRFSLDIASLAMSMGNNSVNLDLYNEYFSEDYFAQNDMWDDAAKDQIIAAFDDDLRGFGNIQLTGLAFSYQRFAFSVNNFFYSNVRIPQNLLTVPLRGLGTEPLPLNDFSGEMIAGTEIAFSTSKVLYEWDFFDYFSLGATFKYFLGHAFARIEEAEGTVLSNEDSIAVSGNYRALIAFPFDNRGKSGDGVGLDLGAAAIVGEKLIIGLTLSNIIGSINFGEVEEEVGSISMFEPGLNQDEFDNFSDYIDSILVTSDTTYISPEIIRYKLPKTMLISLNYAVKQWMTVEFDYQQGFNQVAGGSTIPRLALGTEIRYLKILPLRFGFALGGIQGTTIAAGFGLKLGAFQVDFAAAGQRGLFNSSKGLNLAISPKIRF